MVVCPRCGTNIDADFGIQRCPSCSTNVIIELDGSARTEESGAAEEMPPAHIATAPEFMAPAFDQEVSDPQEVPPAPLIPDLPPTPDPPPVLMKPLAAPKNEGDFSDIAAFGNSGASMAKEGMYIYDVLIWNIDTREVKEQLREALTDMRFAWDVEKILNSIQQGAVRINAINSVKSSLLVNRIKNLPIGISWEQKLITDAGGA